MTDQKAILPKIDRAPQTLRDIVQARMREAIIDGRFAPGDRLVERPLCEQLGVSRTVVRETIRFLEAEGLVEILPNKGPIVASLTWEQAKQIYDIRLQLEGSAAAACTAKQSREFGAKLSKAVKAVHARKNDAEWSDFLKATTHFYELIFMEAGHEIAWNIVQRLNGRISRLRALTVAAKDRERSGMSHLMAIHDSILSGSADAARAAVEAHISEAALIAERSLNVGEARDA
ncbi:GntR family transcriptional regulator [Tateyamaria omphalii]|uniref:GntR family transcriptional regulator n=1 Tax=Tateyamaria omphalii TaxID=299262 RepID=UPI001672CC15|nr:GntR family transcriptional regulator [Tateyamaria omphalii]GGX59597.1 GntR family transcriptional regulator [Tateyamaria omphalii]